jgi:hypothetical protein
VFAAHAVCITEVYRRATAWQIHQTFLLHSLPGHSLCTGVGEKGKSITCVGRSRRTWVLGCSRGAGHQNLPVFDYICSTETPLHTPQVRLRSLLAHLQVELLRTWQHLTRSQQRGTRPLPSCTRSIWQPAAGKAHAGLCQRLLLPDQSAADLLHFQKRHPSAHSSDVHSACIGVTTLLLRALTVGAQCQSMRYKPAHTQGRHTGCQVMHSTVAQRLQLHCRCDSGAGQAGHHSFRQRAEPLAQAAGREWRR